MALLDELRAMAIFATVVRCGSFAAAARELALTRAVVSHHVGALEARLGVPLAYRSTRSFSLTPAGEAFRVHCERLLDEASDGLRGMELLRAEPQGEVRLTCSHHFGNKRILPALLAFRRRYPAIRLHIAMGDANVDLVQQGVDLAVRAGPLLDSTLYARPLVREATLLCASPAYVKRYGMPTTAAALKEHRWVIYPPSQRADADPDRRRTHRYPGAGRHRHRQRGVTAGLRACRRRHCTPARLRRRRPAGRRRTGAGAAAGTDRTAGDLPGAFEKDRPQRPIAARLSAGSGARGWLVVASGNNAVRQEPASGRACPTAA